MEFLSCSFIPISLNAIPRVQGFVARSESINDRLGQIDNRSTILNY